MLHSLQRINVSFFFSFRSFSDEIMAATEPLSGYRWFDPKLYIAKERMEKKDIQTEAETKIGAETETKIDAETETETKIDAEAETETKIETGTKIES